MRAMKTELLIAMVDMIEAATELAVGTQNEIIALERTLKELNPAFADAYARHRIADVPARSSPEAFAKLREALLRDQLS